MFVEDERTLNAEDPPHLSKMQRDFIMHLVSQVYTTLPNQPLELSRPAAKFPPSMTFAQQAPTVGKLEALGDNVTENDIMEIILSYENRLNKEAKHAEEKQIKLQKLGFSTEQDSSRGKHVAALCQACQLGVCTYDQRPQTLQSETGVKKFQGASCLDARKERGAARR